MAKAPKSPAKVPARPLTGADQPVQFNPPANPDAGSGTGKNADILALAKKRYDQGYTFNRENMQEQYFDLQFYDGQYNAQWPSEAVQARMADNRPILTFNQLPPRVRQITGDMRQMRPSVKAVPVDDRGDPKTAEIISGLIRYVENRSNATNVYFRAADSQVVCGIGAWMVVREYQSPHTFNQELRIVLIKDPVAVLWDPDSIEITREDAQWVHIPVDMTRAAFDAYYPGFDPTPIDSATTPTNVGYWQTDGVRVSQYWWKEKAKKLLAMTPDGAVMDLTDKPDELAQARLQGARIEEREGVRVRVCKMTANDIIEEPVDWPGSYIPVVPLIGEEIVIGKKVVRKGLVRNAKDAQRAYNYFRSTQAEVIGLQPKSPWLGTDENFKAFEDEWATANVKNWPYLRYTPDPKNSGQAPSRVQPAVSSQGVNEAVMMAQEDLKSVTGIYDASLGAKSNETSGKAVLARQREGDVGSFVYVSNFQYAIQQTGRIICDLAPHVYDTTRTMRIIGEDGKIDVVTINKPVQSTFEGEDERYENDITVGAYDVVMEMGPSYTTRREEARDGMMQLAQSAPQLVQAFPDLFVKSMDWPLADKISKRLEKMLPADIRLEEAQEAGDEETAQKIVQQQQQQAEQAKNQPPPPEVVKAITDVQKAEIEAKIKQIDLDIAEITRATAEANALVKVAGMTAPEITNASPAATPPTAIENAQDGQEPGEATNDHGDRLAAVEALLTALLTRHDEGAETPQEEAAEPPAMEMAEGPEMPPGGPSGPPGPPMQMPQQQPPPGGFFNGPEA